MPELSRFYGIVVAMFSEQGAKHKSPHVHVRYGSDKASYTLDGKVLAGHMPPTANKLVKEWLSVHKSELYKAWDASVQGEAPAKIEPLK